MLVLRGQQLNREGQDFRTFAGARLQRDSQPYRGQNHGRMELSCTPQAIDSGDACRHRKNIDLAPLLRHGPEFKDKLTRHFERFLGLCRRSTARDTNWH